MKGTIQKVENGWEVSYTKPRTDNQNGYYLGRLPVSSKSLSNPHLSTYWVDGREVEFEILHCIPNDLEPTRGETLSFDSVKYAKIIHDDYVGENSWDRIERELSEQDINGTYETIKWLKENYNLPIRK
jgi:hypothetical protein